MHRFLTLVLSDSALLHNNVQIQLRLTLPKTTAATVHYMENVLRLIQKIVRSVGHYKSKYMGYRENVDGYINHRSIYRASGHNLSWKNKG